LFPPPDSPRLPGVKRDLVAAEYRCPGETYAVSRAVHLGRLAGYYPSCRDCPRREDTVGLSSRQILRLADVAARAHPPKLFSAEGVGSVAIDDLDTRRAKRIAVEFARRLETAERRLIETRRVSEVSESSTRLRCGFRCRATAIVGCDGRLATAAIIAAMIEGLRWSGCEVIDIGPASAPCTARTIEHLAADGGVFVGNAGGAPHTVGLKLWAVGEPLSQGGLLDDIAAALQDNPSEAVIDRPSRICGPLHRLSAADTYLDEFRPAYHALRPLSFVLDCPLAPVVAYLEDLIKNVACRILPREMENGTIGEQVVRARAHFGVEIDDDGENCRVFDDQGRTVAANQLLAIVAGNLEGPLTVGRDFRQQTYRAMREAGAAFAADRAGRLWYAGCHAPLPDALQTLTLLLVLLSRDDAPFSAILDRQASAV
jgi:phosphomannomutase